MSLRWKLPFGVGLVALGTQLSGPTIQSKVISFLIAFGGAWLLIDVGEEIEK